MNGDIAISSAKRGEKGRASAPAPDGTGTVLRIPKDALGGFDQHHIEALSDFILADDLGLGLSAVQGFDQQVVEVDVDVFHGDLLEVGIATSSTITLLSGFSYVNNRAKLELFCATVVTEPQNFAVSASGALGNVSIALLGWFLDPAVVTVSDGWNLV
jgi:hypothetical protein